MPGVLEELQAAVTSAAERVGPSVVGLGRGCDRPTVHVSALNGSEEIRIA